MANSIALFKVYTKLIDEVYKANSKTAVLDGAPELAREGANANELIIQKMDMSGLGAYSRNSGYVDGDVTLTNETVKCNFDRGRMFNVDSMDDEETANLAFARLAGEFERTKVIPELDAFRFAEYASAAGITKGTPTTFKDGLAVVKELRKACSALDEAEVPEDQRILFITSDLLGMVEDLDTTKSKKVLDRFAKIETVPQSRFYTAITQYAGKSAELGDQLAGGYAKAEGAADINFMVVHKPAVIQFEKHKAPKVIKPEVNQTSDGYKYGYRLVSIAETYENKEAGIYLSATPTV